MVRKNILNSEILELCDRYALYGVINAKGEFLLVSEALASRSGYKKEEIEGLHYSVLRHPNKKNIGLYRMARRLKKKGFCRTQIELLAKDGTLFWVEAVIERAAKESQTQHGYIFFAVDITYKKELERRIKNVKRYGSGFGIIMFDIDHFKEVNDLYGHHVGDRVLRDIASCVAKHIRADDIVARWGGEEFVILANVGKIEELERLVQKIQFELAAALREPFKRVTLSFGLTLYRKFEDEMSLQKRVDKALYGAKHKGRNRYEIL